ncbi:hypothetical protein B0O99DRAFT_56322 [Bisporella sp. PMI_857]|nr:hypothetical protein B0O99DRAFT_56322 [Bisporella sp. PMI_857]
MSEEADNGEIVTHGIPSQPSSCNFCTIILPSRNALLRHLKVCSELPTCDSCDTSFQSTIELEKHFIKCLQAGSNNSKRQAWSPTYLTPITHGHVPTSPHPSATASARTINILAPYQCFWSVEPEYAWLRHNCWPQMDTSTLTTHMRIAQSLNQRFGFGFDHFHQVINAWLSTDENALRFWTQLGGSYKEAHWVLRPKQRDRMFMQEIVESDADVGPGEHTFVDRAEVLSPGRKTLEDAYHRLTCKMEENPQPEQEHP